MTTFDYLLNQYRLAELNNHLNKLNILVNNKMNINPETQTIMPNYLIQSSNFKEELKSQFFDLGNKIYPLDIHSYQEIINFYKNNIEKNMKAMPPYIPDYQNIEESDYDDIDEYEYTITNDTSKTYHICKEIEKDVLVFNNINNKTTLINSLKAIFEMTAQDNGLLIGIILDVLTYKNERNLYNITHPVILQTIIDNDLEILGCENMLYVYFKTEEQAEFLRRYNEDSYEEVADIDAYKKYLKDSVDFSLALYANQITKPQSLEFTDSISSTSDMDIFFDKVRLLDYKDNINLRVNAYLPENQTIPGLKDTSSDSSSEERYNIPYYLPIDLYSKNITIPYYGGIIALEPIVKKTNLPKYTDNMDVNAVNVSPFYTGNLQENISGYNYIAHLCTGKDNNRHINTLCRVNRSNPKSAYHESQFNIGFLDFIEYNVNLSKTLFYKYIGETIENRLQSSRDFKSEECSIESLETRVAEQDNPFERNISYQQRISS
jgi:hypothetical protein